MRFSLLEGGFSDSSFAFIVGNTQVPISSDLSECFKSESRRKSKSSSLKWSEHKEDVFSPSLGCGVSRPKKRYFMHTYSLLRVRHIATSRRNATFWHFDLLHGIKWTFTKRNLPELFNAFLRLSHMFLKVRHMTSYSERRLRRMVCKMAANLNVFKKL